MIDFTNWFTDTAAIEEETRAALAWRQINDKPASVVFRKPDGTDLTAQTVRIESDNSVTESEGTAGRGPVRKVIVFGVKGHPTVTDTDMKEGYRFNYSSDQYRIMDTILTLGEVQGVAEATG